MSARLLSDFWRLCVALRACSQHAFFKKHANNDQQGRLATRVADMVQTRTEQVRAVRGYACMRIGQPSLVAVLASHDVFPLDLWLSHTGI